MTTLSPDALDAATAAQAAADTLIARAVATSGIAAPFVVPALLNAAAEQIVARPAEERRVSVILALGNLARMIHSLDPAALDDAIPAMIESLEAKVVGEIVEVDAPLPDPAQAN